MLRYGYFYRFTIALLCILLLFTLPSCKSSEILHTPTISPSTHQPIKFVTNLTQTGVGIVRNVPPFSCISTEPATFAGSFDVRWLDCPKYLSSEQHQKLLYAIPCVTFNTDTVWPSEIPYSYDYSGIMEAGKNPGLGINGLHSKGITGKGVSIAIIDQPLFTDHPEYRDNLVLYEEIHVGENETASIHGSAVSSIAVGKTCGVAPDAKLYYWGVNNAKDPYLNDRSDSNTAFADSLAVAVNRMLEVNAKLPVDDKIRVLSISHGIKDLNDTGVKVFLEAVDRAKEAGVFVITTTTYQYYDFLSKETDFAGLGKIDYLSDPDDLSTYSLGYFETSNAEEYIDKLLLPMDARTTADPSGAEDYVFYAYGGYSWIAPYLAGLYALAIQVTPNITPDIFWKTALATSDKLKVRIDIKKYTFNHVISPNALIDKLK